MKIIFNTVILFLFINLAQAEVKTQAIEYQSDGQSFTG